MNRPLAIFSIALAACTASAASNHFSDWPENANPAIVGKQLTENFLPRKFRFETDPKKAHLGVIYPEVCTWYGALTYADLSKNVELRDRLMAKFEPLMSPPLNKMINRSAHVDFRVFGTVPIEIYLQTKKPAYLELGRGLADAQWEKTTPDGITAEARYWIDDMYMIPAVQVQAFRATGDKKYIDRAAVTMVAYLNALQQKNGLFYHGTNASFYWGRGNGWMAAGMAELLRSMPENHAQRERILKGYQAMMAGLLANQAADGMWRQLIDDKESWAETSGTAMFAFSMITGVKKGWLPAETYGPAARKAWLALVGYLDKDGNIREVCAGTNKATDRQFYLDRPRNVGDLHGQAPMLWCVSALLR